MCMHGLGLIFDGRLRIKLLSMECFCFISLLSLQSVIHLISTFRTTFKLFEGIGLVDGPITRSFKICSSMLCQN